MAKDKASDRDGFPPLFFRHQWAIVCYEVMEVIQLFFAIRYMPVAWNRTFIALLSKRQDASELSHYRLINSCTILYKIYAKIMIGRMKPILPWLISLEQRAFIRGRSISSSMLVAQEFMHELQRALAHRCRWLSSLTYSMLMIRYVEISSIRPQKALTFMGD